MSMQQKWSLGQIVWMLRKKIEYLTEEGKKLVLHAKFLAQMLS